MATMLHGVERPVPVNQGRLQPSWFDIWRLPPDEDEYDEVGINESTPIIRDLIRAQVHSGIDFNRIVLVGSSQGAALSLIVGLTTKHELGGLVSLSGWIPPRVRDVSPLQRY
jgi:lysophospholipase II